MGNKIKIEEVSGYSWEIPDDFMVELALKILQAYEEKGM